MKRGIYLVANRNSQALCENLIYSIRESGCQLPIRLIHFGGKKVESAYILDHVELQRFEDFAPEAKHFINSLAGILTDCPRGFLYRFLAWFSDWDEFIYSDNDIVALCNWEILFDYLHDYDLVHADEEYTTGGIYNYYKPDLISGIFGPDALNSQITAGHIVVKKNGNMIEDINKAIEWFHQNKGIPKLHDQSLLHIASLLGNWRTNNLCKEPHNWLSSWAGDYKNALDLVQAIQHKRNLISHLHYSGGAPKGNLAIQELLFSSATEKQRLEKLTSIGLRFLSKLEYVYVRYSKFRNMLKRI